MLVIRTFLVGAIILINVSSSGNGSSRATAGTLVSLYTETAPTLDGLATAGKFEFHGYCDDKHIIQDFWGKKRASRRNRTHTHCEVNWILSPARLFHLFRNLGDKLGT